MNKTHVKTFLAAILQSVAFVAAISLIGALCIAVCSKAAGQSRLLVFKHYASYELCVAAICIIALSIKKYIDYRFGEKKGGNTYIIVLFSPLFLAWICSCLYMVWMIFDLSKTDSSETPITVLFYAFTYFIICAIVLYLFPILFSVATDIFSVPHKDASVKIAVVLAVIVLYVFYGGVNFSREFLSSVNVSSWDINENKLRLMAASVPTVFFLNAIASNSLMKAVDTILASRGGITNERGRLPFIDDDKTPKSI